MYSMKLDTFGTFRTTYPLTTFILIISMMYPHPKTIIRRAVGTLLTTLIAIPVVGFVMIDCYNSFLRKDLLNLVYHSTVVGPYLGGVTKIVASMYKSKLGDELINEIDRDYRTLNTMPEPYKNIARASIAFSWKYCEKYWFYVVLLSVATFPAVPMIMNFKGAFFDDNPQKYMVHDVVIPLTEPEYRLETPAYEIVYAAMLYVTCLIMTYYIGYDAFFAISVNHACLKISLFCLAFEEALKYRDKRVRCRKLGHVVEEQLRLYDCIWVTTAIPIYFLLMWPSLVSAFEEALKYRDKRVRCRKLGHVVEEQLRLYDCIWVTTAIPIYFLLMWPSLVSAFEEALKYRDKRVRCRKLGHVVEEQLRLYEYVDKIQGFFNIYLGVILFAALIQIGTCLYHIKESDEFEIQYVMMGWGTICCIFFPCAFATKLRFASEESAVKFYCGGWENIHCVSTRRIVLFMITRAQIPIEIKGFNWIAFDMDLFVSILKSAYSIYTLLCS